MPFLAGLGIVTLLAAGGGMYLGGQLSVKTPEKMEQTVSSASLISGDVKDKEESEGEEGLEETAKASEAVRLDPIIVGLSNSNNAFLRVELAIIADDPKAFSADKEKLRISSEISTFARTLTLKQISGPSGYLHFREDIIDRVRLLTDGTVDDVLILSMVAE
jgi:flagellar FliL protein